MTVAASSGPAALVQELRFGAGGNGGACQIDGWSTPEDGFTWSIGRRSRCRLHVAPGLRSMVLEILAAPLVFAPPLPRQRVQILVNDVIVADEVLDAETTVSATLPDCADGPLIVTLQHPDAASPAQLGMNEDTRVLGLMVQRMRLYRVAQLPPASSRPFLPRMLLPWAPESPESLDTEIQARTGLTLTGLLGEFESIGHNCEFGLMQRACGAEPLGLLRFGGVKPARLLDGLAAGFAGIADPAGMDVMTGQVNGREEYLVRDGTYGVELHTNQFGGDMAADRLIAKMAPHLAFLQRLFAETLGDASRIFVLHHPTIHNTARALPYLTQLQRHGRNTLLYVTAHATVIPGTIVQERADLFHGYTDLLPPMHEGDRVNIAAWISLCVNAHRLWRATLAAGKAETGAT